MTEYRYYQLRQCVSIPAVRSSLLDEIEVNIFLLVPSQTLIISLGLLPHPPKRLSSIVLAL